METVAIISLIGLVLSLGRVATAAFMDSMPRGILCFLVPGYVLWFAWRRYKGWDRVPLTLLLCTSLIAFAICLVYAEA